MQPLVLIPTYNERDNLKRLITAVRQASPATAILVIDDNSPDGTGALADRLAAADTKVHVLHRAQKKGLGRAYQAGFTWALAGSFDPICTMDADFSHDPVILPRLIKPVVADQTDICVGSRYIAGGRILGWTKDRHLLSVGANRLAKFLLGLRPHDVTAGYKCYRRSFLESFNLGNLISPGYAFQVEMLERGQRGGWRILEIPITFRDRVVGYSKVSRHELVTSIRSLVLLASRRASLLEFIKFCLVGGINFAIDLVTTNLGVIILHWSAVWAGYFGVILALLNSFILNRGWTFRAKRGKVWPQMIRFFIINGSGAAINGGLYTLLLLHFGWHYNLAKIVAIIGSISWNFIGTKFWVFRGGQRSS